MSPLYLTYGVILLNCFSWACFMKIGFKKHILDGSWFKEPRLLFIRWFVCEMREMWKYLLSLFRVSEMFNIYSLLWNQFTKNNEWNMEVIFIREDYFWVYAWNPLKNCSSLIRSFGGLFCRLRSFCNACGDSVTARFNVHFGLWKKKI